MPGPSFRRLGERSIHQGRVIEVSVGRFATPEGETFERDVVHHPGAVSVVPVVHTGTGGDPSVVLVRQYRAPLDRTILEIPAGLRDVAGEMPEDTARRELVEEVGLHAGRLDKLCEFQNSPGFSDERIWVYLAVDPEEATVSAQSHEERHMTIERYPLGDIPGMIGAGLIEDAKTIIGLLLAREALA